MNKLELAPEDTVVSVDIKWVDDWWATVINVNGPKYHRKIAFFRVVTVKYSDDLEDGDDGVYTYCTPMWMDSQGYIEDARECDEDEDEYVEISQGKSEEIIIEALK